MTFLFSSSIPLCHFRSVTLYRLTRKPSNTQEWLLKGREADKLRERQRRERQRSGPSNHFATRLCVNECSCLKCVCVLYASACIRVNHWHYAANCIHQKSVRQDCECYYTTECGPGCAPLVQHAHLRHSYKYTQHTRKNTKILLQCARVCGGGVGYMFVCV
jgi:hypothetical protein